MSEKTIQNLETVQYWHINSFCQEMQSFLTYTTGNPSSCASGDVKHAFFQLGWSIWIFSCLWSAEVEEICPSQVFPLKINPLQNKIIFFSHQRSSAITIIYSYLYQTMSVLIAWVGATWEKACQQKNSWTWLHCSKCNEQDWYCSRQWALLSWTKEESFLWFSL